MGHSPNEKITHIDLFSGIGGFALAADRVFGNVEHVFCDNDPFCQEVLKKHWPTSPVFSDIRTFTNTRGEKSGGLSSSRRKALAAVRKGGAFILTGGFPCQSFSQAGRRKGEEDDRFLWPEMARVIGEFKPQWVIAENVRGLLTQGGGVVFERVCTDLESLGYEVQPIIIPAVAVGAPHRRDRVWFIAHAKRDGQPARAKSRCSPKTIREKSTRKDNSLNTTRTGRLSASRKQWRENWFKVATRLCRVDDGLPRRLDRNPRLKALGNAIVPQAAEEIMRAIEAVPNTLL